MDTAHRERTAAGQVLRDLVPFRGHPMVRALHPTTIEVTTDDQLTARGDCIIGVRAGKGCAQISEPVKAALRTAGSRVTIRIVVGGLLHTVHAMGDPGLELTSLHEVVVRKSTFLSDRTLALRADCAARDIPRPMVGLLTDPETTGRLEIEVG